MTIHPGRRFALSRAPGLRGLVRRLWAREDPDVCVFLACVHPGDVVLDVGANRGDYTLLFSDLVGPDGRVHAFEPVEESCRAFEEAVRRHGRHDNVRLWRTAVGDWVGETAIHVPAEDLRQAALVQHHGRSWPETGRVVTQPCPITSLDAWGRESQVHRVDFVKCDTEGAELSVFRGARELIALHRPTMHVELSLDWSRDFGYEPGELIAFLGAQGYREFRLVEREFRRLGPGLEELEAWRALGSVNLLCLSPHRPRGDGRFRRW